MLAKRCSVNPGNVSRWVNGSALPDGKAMGKLIASVSEAQAAQLLTAWISDFLPPGAEKYVTVKPRDPATIIEEDPADAWPADLSKASRLKFIDFSRLAMRYPDIMTVVDVLHSAANRLAEKPRKTRNKR